MEKTLCADCGHVIFDGEAFETADGDMICEDCFDKYYFQCDCCGKIYGKQDIYNVDGDTVCSKCIEDGSKYFYCESCEAYHSVNDRWGITGDDTTICDDCRNEYYSECDDCGEVYLTDDIIWDDYEDAYYCADCDRRRSRKKVIHDYSYKPRPKFKTSTHDEFVTDTNVKELFFGVELEVDDGDSPGKLAEALCDLSDDIYCKHDGSLDDGVEIVTHPCTLDYHMQGLGWDSICKTAVDFGFKSHNTRTCGLHIHVGRWQLGETGEQRRQTTAKIVWLVWRHFDVLAAFSRREREKLDQWAAKPSLDIPISFAEYKFFDAALRSERDGRYQAVNLQNDDTVEFRFFRGSLVENTVKAAIQLSSNLCLYAKTHCPQEILSSRFEDILDMQHFPELDQYLTERKLTWKNPEVPLLITDKELNKAFEQGTRSIPDDGFQPGDIVQVINANGNNVPGLRHAIGRNAIIEKRGDDTIFDFLLAFDYVDNTWMHSGRGTTGKENCYWVHKGNIAFVGRPSDLRP